MGLLEHASGGPAPKLCNAIQPSLCTWQRMTAVAALTVARRRMGSGTLLGGVGRHLLQNRLPPRSAPTPVHVAERGAGQNGGGARGHGRHALLQATESCGSTALLSDRRPRCDIYGSQEMGRAVVNGACHSLRRTRKMGRPHWTRNQRRLATHQRWGAEGPQTAANRQQLRAKLRREMIRCRPTAEITSTHAHAHVHGRSGEGQGCIRKGGGGSGTQKFEHEKWSKSIFPFVFHFSPR